MRTGQPAKCVVKLQPRRLAAWLNERRDRHKFPMVAKRLDEKHGDPDRLAAGENFPPLVLPGADSGRDVFGKVIRIIVWDSAQQGRRVQVRAKRSERVFSERGAHG